MKIVGTLLALVALVVIAAGAYVYTGSAEVAASSGEGPLLHWVLETARERAVERESKGITVPDDWSAQARIAAGAPAFDDMCAGCHGAPGRQPFVGAQDMNPSPPDLAELASTRSPAELFWVIKHGIRMTGMPAWGATHSDDELWELVAFTARLPELSPDAYAQLAAAGGEGHGHHHDHTHSGSVDEQVEEHHHGDSDNEQVEEHHHSDSDNEQVEEHHHSDSEGEEHSHHTH